MTSTIDLFIEEARGVSVADAAHRLGLKFRRGASPRLRGGVAEHPQACPACGGTDTFAFNTSKNKWNCRKGGAGGADAIGLAAHVRGLDLHRRAGFLEACAAVLGRDIPEGLERESDDDRRAREARLAEQRRHNEEEAARQEAKAADFREREGDKARGIVDHAGRLTGRDAASCYLMHRAGAAPSDEWLRSAPAVTYWHGQDDRGRSVDLHCGPAMIGRFVAPDMAVIGCHITWIDLDNPPKFRPGLHDRETGEVLPTKKMRGTKKGGLIPIAGDPSAQRWAGGEGIENGVAFGGWEGFRADTFYFAAGDLGNLCGPADPASKFAHPDLTTTDKAGRVRPVMVAGPVPAPGSDRDAMWVGDHVTELVLLADSDSEPVMTAAAMVRARARFARPGRLIPVVWGRRGMDLADLLRGAGPGATREPDWASDGQSAPLERQPLSGDAALEAGNN